MHTPQTPPRTFKESLHDMRLPLIELSSMTNLLAEELAEIAKETLDPKGAEVARLVTACAKRPLADACLDDYGVAGDAPRVARLLSNAISSAAYIAHKLEELKALHGEPFETTARSKNSSALPPHSPR
jgi:hypothetical protein